MKKESKKKVYVTVIDSMVAICAKAVLSKEQFEKASANKEHVVYLLCGTNVELWFIDNDKPPYNIGIRSFMTGHTTSEAIVKEEENVKNVLDQLIEQIDKFPENKPEENEETQDAPADDHKEFYKALGKDVEGSLKQHFGEEVKYALFTYAGDHVSVESTICPAEIIYMLALATAD